MTLFTQCREDEQVVKARQTRRVAISPGEEPIPVFSAAELDAYDTALLRAAVRAIAAKVREDAEALVLPNQKVVQMAVADFIERMGNE